MKLNELTADQRASVRLRFIARCQLTSLHLHDDLCMQVITDYGHPVDYAAGTLPDQARRILDVTSMQDAVFAADALAPLS